MWNVKEINDSVVEFVRDNTIISIVIGLVFMLITFGITDCIAGKTTTFNSTIQAKWYEPPYTTCSTDSEGKVSCHTTSVKYMIAVMDKDDYVQINTSPMKYSMMNIKDAVICKSRFGLTGMRYLTDCNKIN